MHDTGSGKRWRYKADERFPMASTFKVLACAALLARVDAGQEEISRRVQITKDDLVPHAPVTEGKVGRGMSLGELCEATTRTSDNPAANRILDALAGPSAVTRFMRSLGDGTTRLDNDDIRHLMAFLPDGRERLRMLAASAANPVHWPPPSQATATERHIPSA